MAIIKTKRNYVYAYEPQHGDGMVRTLIVAGEAGGGGYRCLTTQHIDQYQVAVDWAVSMADQFEHPVHIVPITLDECRPDHGDELQRRFNEMTPAERHELRREVVTTAATVMRDCNDPDVRADAFDVLVKMGAVAG